jgi:predicted TIM-barrel fold metal-dependent hydrolase
MAAPLAAVAAPPTPKTSVAFRMPKGACDCHTHVFLDAKKFPMIPTRTYTPELATAEQLRAAHAALGIERVVIVTPSVYGNDNSATAAGIKALGKSARGVAVVAATAGEKELRALDHQGFRGIRLNLGTGPAPDLEQIRERFERGVEQVNPFGWHIQVFAKPQVVAALRPLVMASPVPVVFDHFGDTRGALGLKQEGFAELLEMVGSGKAYVKISAPYNQSEAPGYADMKPLAQALIAANPANILWATNWPHPNTKLAAGKTALDPGPYQPIDDGAMLNLLADWEPNESKRRTILVENPARLYGY